MAKRKKTTATRKRKPSLTAKERIMNSQEWQWEGIEYCFTNGEWPEWESRMLAHIAAGHGSGIEDGVCYACGVMKRPWPELETLLVECLCSPSGVVSGNYPAANSSFCLYAAYVGKSSNLESLILQKSNSVLAVLYASRSSGKRWPQAETMILNADSPSTEAVLDVYYEGKHLRQNQITVYAKGCFGGRWPAFEKKVRQGNCHPLTAASYAAEIHGRRWQAAESMILRHARGEAARMAVVHYARDVVRGRWKSGEAILCTSTESMLAYAAEVVGGRLPAQLHNALVLGPHDDNVREYMEKYGKPRA